ncbi:MAG: phosphate acetyltransferase [Clostridia bacterium]|nr:phosphate acetyltransferase [Clostridia bacterium]
MSKLMESIKLKASMLNKRIVLAEGEEPRIIRAAAEVVSKGIARITLIGNPRVIKEKCPDVALDGVDIVDIATSPDRIAYAELLFEMRKSKGMTMEEAEQTVLNPLYFGVLMIKAGKADGMVAGSINATGDVLRPALQIIKTAKGINTVSSCFLMALPEGSAYGEEGVMVFGDCAVNPMPDAKQLADIAIASASSAKCIAGINPKVAMLSFSSKGSAKHDVVTKVQEATALVKQLAPNLAVDGELQLDAAIVPEVAQLKAKGSSVAGYANVLIFPDLQSGNIGYKLVQRLGNAEAVGPICQGFAAPVNDLSRGCSVDDVVSVVAITALQTNI